MLYKRLDCNNFIVVLRSWSILLLLWFIELNWRSLSSYFLKPDLFFWKFLKNWTDKRKWTAELIRIEFVLYHLKIRKFKMITIKTKCWHFFKLYWIDLNWCVNLHYYIIKDDNRLKKYMDTKRYRAEQNIHKELEKKYKT